MKSIPFTVFTPTYNRAHTLRRVYDSLLQQRADLFEWLVVDDGSTDGTAKLLSELQAESPFEIRVIRQPNGGKHRAHNAAIRVARGELTIILDSDDELVNGAIEALWCEWQSIDVKHRAQIAGVLGHCVDESGEIVGLRYPSNPLDGRFFELTADGKMVGEKMPCYRSDVLRAYPFPEMEGSTAYVPEGVVWARIDERYLVRCFDAPVRIYHRSPSDGASIMNKYAKHRTNAWGRMQYFSLVLNMSGQYFPRYARVFANAAANYWRCALHAGVPISGQLKQIRGATARLLWIAGMPVGIVAWYFDRAEKTRSRIAGQMN